MGSEWEDAESCIPTSSLLPSSFRQRHKLSNEDLLYILILVSFQACVGEHCLLPLLGNNLPFVGSLETWKSTKTMKASGHPVNQR